MVLSRVVLGVALDVKMSKKCTSTGLSLVQSRDRWYDRDVTLKYRQCIGWCYEVRISRWETSPKSVG
jgi:hypothetical protein